MLNKGLFTSKTADWETPQDFYNELDRKFNFDLDPCSTKKNAKCVNFFTKKDDGLNRVWLHITNLGNIRSRVFMNPPYGREIGKWVEKAHDEVKEKNTNFVVALLPARTDTKWFHDYIYNKAEIRFLKGRLKFGGSKNSAPFPSMIVIFR